MAENQIHINNICVALQHCATAICSTDANKPEKKGQVLKIYIYCMAKLSIKHLFICCG